MPMVSCSCTAPSLHGDVMTGPRRLLIYLSQQMSLPSARLRLLEPASFLAASYAPLIRSYVDAEGRTLVSDEGWQSGDIVVFQRNFPVPQTLGLIETAKKSGCVLIYETDDAFRLIPDDHPKAFHRAYVPYIEQAMQWFDLITVSSRGLEQEFRRTGKARYMPSMLSPRLWNDATLPAARTASPSEVRIGLVGGEDHAIDFLEIRSVLETIAARHSQVRFIEYGGGAGQALAGIPPERVESHRRNYNYQTHPARLAGMTLDLAAVPLRDDAFNACRSDIKFLEFGFLGVPAVFSPIGEYPEVVRMGGSGLLATTPDEWLEALDQLIVDTDARCAMGARAREHVVRTRLLSTANNPLRECLEALPSG